MAPDGDQRALQPVLGAEWEARYPRITAWAEKAIEEILGAHVTGVIEAVGHGNLLHRA